MAEIKITIIRAVLAFALVFASTLDARSESGPGAEVSFSKPAQLTRGPKHHFFGYYGVSPWDESEKLHLAIETDFGDRMPGPDDEAAIGLTDMDTGVFTSLTRTRAWNFQQGAMQRWLRGGRRFIYNDVIGGRAVSVIMDAGTGEKRVAGPAISALSADGSKALSVNYARMGRLRPVVGYPGLADSTRGVLHPGDDGVSIFDTGSGVERLVLSVADVVRAYRGTADLSDKELYICHTEFNPSGARFLFLARYHTGVEIFDTAMFTAGADGKDLRMVVDFGNRVSHFGWLGDDRLIATMTAGDGTMAHVAFDDVENPSFERIAESVLRADGHPSVSPGGGFIVTDTYPDSAMRQTLYIHDLEAGSTFEIAKFRHPAKFMGPLRCDLHPRWSADGAMISVDSAHGGTRQIYVLKTLSTAGAGRARKLD